MAEYITLENVLIDLIISLGKQELIEFGLSIVSRKKAINKIASILKFYGIYPDLITITDLGLLVRQYLKKIYGEKTIDELKNYIETFTYEDRNFNNKKIMNKVRIFLNKNKPLLIQ